MPKSEAFTLELSARMAVLRKLHCIESGDDLGPVCVGFGRADWVGVDGRLTGPLFFFIAVSWLVQGREEENFQPPFKSVVTLIFRKLTNMAWLLGEDIRMGSI
jgi:hypothetical protein